MDSFPIELIENILRFCSGNEFCQLSRLSTTWLKAKQNVERTNATFWRNRCRQEIESHLIEELNPYRQPLEKLDAYECKELYVKWFRSQTIHNLPNECLKCNETFGSALSGFENVTALTVTGNLVITGHRSGRVLLIDINNNMKPIQITRHELAVNDLVAVNLVGDETYEFHKLGNDNYPTAHPSFTNHHHIISIEEGSRVYISLIAPRGTAKDFQICPLSPRHFLKGRVSRDLFAVSTKEALDISLFRLVLPKQGVVPIYQSLKAELIQTISCRQVFNSAYHWLGLFTFTDLKLCCFCHEFNVIACSDVAYNLSLPKKDNFRWKWKSINELNYEYQSKSVREYDDDLTVKMLNGFSFGDQIFILITSQNEIVFTTDAKTFHLTELDYCLKRKDKITTLCLFGSVLACGTKDGYIYIHKCPTLSRLKYVTHYKPLFDERICNEPITKLSMTDSGSGPILAAATKQRVYLLKWTTEQKWVNTDLKNQSEVDVITID